jgi:hypothetical protein
MVGFCERTICMILIYTHSSDARSKLPPTGAHGFESNMPGRDDR